MLTGFYNKLNIIVLLLYTAILRIIISVQKAVKSMFHTHIVHFESL